MRVHPCVLLAAIALASTPACRESATPARAPRQAVASFEALPPLVVDEADWPWWRGPTRDGKARGEPPPIEWGPDKNVIWKTPVPGRGHSTPIVCGRRVILTTADEERKEQLLVCLDRATGAPAWKKVLHSGGFMRLHRKNSQASATPACDGELVFSVFINGGAIHATACDLDGNVAWTRNVGTFDSEHGYGSSPVLHGSFVIVLADDLGGGFVAALHRKTGDVIWKTDRPNDSRHGSYATPIVGVVAQRPQLLVSGTHWVSSYNPDSGELLWYASGPAQVTANTMAFRGDLVWVSGGYPEKEILCIRADGSGEVTDTAVVWSSTRGVAYVPSPLLHDGRLYLVSDDGIVSCRDPRTGDDLWRERVDGRFSASPVLAGDHILLTNESGVTSVLATGDEFRLVATNDLGDGGGFASPVICDGRLFLRTGRHVVCIGREG